MHTDFQLSKVGISFAMHASLCSERNLCFVSDYAEDFNLLDSIRKAGVPMLMAPYLTYLVRGAGRERHIHQGTASLVHYNNP